MPHIWLYEDRHYQFMPALHDAPMCILHVPQPPLPSSLQGLSIPHRTLHNPTQALLAASPLRTDTIKDNGARPWRGFSYLVQVCSIFSVIVLHDNQNFSFSSLEVSRLVSFKAYNCASVTVTDLNLSYLCHLVLFITLPLFSPQMA